MLILRINQGVIQAAMPNFINDTLDVYLSQEILQISHVGQRVYEEICRCQRVPSENVQVGQRFWIFKDFTEVLD